MTAKATAAVHVDNSQVRVTEWSFAAGAETGDHVHEMDYVIVPTVDGRLKLTDPKGAETFADLKRGVSYFRKAGVHHNVINASSHPISFVEIELKGTGKS